MTLVGLTFISYSTIDTSATGGGDIIAVCFVCLWTLSLFSAPFLDYLNGCADP